MNVQDELQKIHSQYGISEKSNYEIQKLFDNQQKRMYSEEEVLKLLRKSHFVEQNIEEWFEQFKKK